MTYKTLTTYQNRYRTLTTDFLQFHDHDIHNLKVESCVKQNGTGKSKCLTIHNFESFELKNESSLGFLHCVGKIGGKLYLVVLRKVEPKPILTEKQQRINKALATAKRAIEAMEVINNIFNKQPNI